MKLEVASKRVMKAKFKKWPLIFLVIPVLMIGGVVKQGQELQKTYDGIYYLTVKNQATKTVDLDKSSWIRISGNQVYLKEGSEEKTYPYDPKTNQFKKGTTTHSCLVNEGLLTVGKEDDFSYLESYVSPTSSMYRGYEEGKVTFRED